MSNVSLDSYEAVVKCPSTLLLFGEYSAIREQPAIAIALPLYVRVGMNLKKSPGIQYSAAYPEPDWGYEELRQFAPTSDSAFKSGLSGEVGIGLRNKLASVLEPSGKGLEIRAVYGFPIECGLASSGALCAALSIGVHVLIHDLDPRKFDEVLNRNLEETIRSPMFRRIFKLAWELEDYIHTPSSGVAPFVSLVGSSDALPIFYFSTRDGMRYHAARLSELEAINRTESSQFLWEKCVFAAMYSGVSRQATTANVKETIKGIEKRVDTNVKELKRAFGGVGFTSDLSRIMSRVKGPTDKANSYILESLWTTFGLITLTAFNQFLSGDVEDIRSMMATAQDLLSFLKVSPDKINEIANVAKLHKIGCKILGSGKGGDVLLFTERENWTDSKFLNEVKQIPGVKGTMHFNSLAIDVNDRQVRHAELTKNPRNRDIEMCPRPLQRMIKPVNEALLQIIPLDTTREQLDPITRKFKKGELETRMAEVEETLKKCLNSNVDIVIYPEYSVPEESIGPIQDLVRGNGKTIVIAGTHLFKKKTEGTTQWFNRCPVITPEETVFQDKICQSPLELFPIQEADVLYRITGSRIGDFCVNICAGLRLDIHELRWRIRDRLDFMFVPSLNRETRTYSNTAKESCYSYYTHVVMANSWRFGGSGLWGPFRGDKEQALYLRKKQRNMDPFKIDLERFRKVWVQRETKDPIYKTPETKTRKTVG